MTTKPLEATGTVASSAADSQAPADASRGDLIVYKVTRRDWINGSGPQERVEYEVGEVVGITRERRVRTVRGRYGDATALDRIIGYDRCWLAAKTVVDVPAACAAAWANPWPSGHTGMPFDSLDQVLALVRPFQTHPVRRTNP